MQDPGTHNMSRNRDICSPPPRFDIGLEHVSPFLLNVHPQLNRAPITPNANVKRVPMKLPISAVPAWTGTGRIEQVGTLQRVQISWMLSRCGSDSCGRLSFRANAKPALTMTLLPIEGLAQQSHRTSTQLASTRSRRPSVQLARQSLQKNARLVLTMTLPPVEGLVRPSHWKHIKGLWRSNAAEMRTARQLALMLNAKSEPTTNALVPLLAEMLGSCLTRMLRACSRPTHRLCRHRLSWMQSLTALSKSFKLTPMGAEPVSSLIAPIGALKSLHYHWTLLFSHGVECKLCYKPRRMSPTVSCGCTTISLPWMLDSRVSYSHLVDLVWEPMVVVLRPSRCVNEPKLSL